MEKLPTPKPEDEGRMTNEAAQEEANMLRARLEVDPKTGKVPATGWDVYHAERGEEFEGKKPSAEDYDAALEALEKLRDLAEKEPVTKTILDVFGQLTAEARRLLLMNLGNPFSEEGEATLDRIKDFRKRFDGARWQLEQLQIQAKKYEGKENK